MTLLKRLKLLAIVALCLASAPVHAAGTTPLALVPQVDSSGNVASGCLLSFFVAGTVGTPQNAFADFGLTQPLSNPLSCDQAGRVPMHWLADGLIHIRLTDSGGSPLVDTTMQVLGPSSGGGGGGGTVDPTTVLATGDLKARYGTGPLTGFARTNGLTIGNATSGATERANADTQALFIYLYGVDSNLVVAPGGRSGNALNDYNANKTIALPDWSGRTLAALDDQGAGAKGRLTATYFGTTSVGGCLASTLGCFGGSESQTLAVNQLPAGITSSALNSISVAPGGGGTGIPLTSTPANVSAASVANCGGGGCVVVPASNSGSWGATSTFSGNNTIHVTSDNTSGAAHPIVSPVGLATIYIKL